MHAALSTLQHRARGLPVRFLGHDLPMRPLALKVAAIVAGCALAMWTPTSAIAQPAPPNDVCATAIPVLQNVPLAGTLVGATPDGSCSCGQGGASAIGPLAGADVYHRFITDNPGLYTFSLCSSVQSTDTVLSLHALCPASAVNQITCDDDGCEPAGSTTSGWPSVVTAYLPANAVILVRIALYSPQASPGVYTLSVTGPAKPLGACCLGSSPGGGCTPLTSTECLSQGGRFLGQLVGCTARVVVPSSYSFAELPAPIPDSPSGELVRSLTVPASVSTSVADTLLRLNILHPWIGDLRVTLERPAVPGFPASSVVILDRPGTGPYGSSADLSGEYAFSDSGPLNLWGPGGFVGAGDSGVVPAAGYFASNSLGSILSMRVAFNGQPAAGVWTVRIRDLQLGDSGILTSATLELDSPFADACSIDPATSGACCRGSLQGGLGNICLVTTTTGCQLVSGFYSGDGSTCGPVPSNPTTCCRANFNAQAGVTVQDIFDFLSAWFRGAASADFNRSGSVTVQDIFDFLAAWFAGCV